MQKKKKADEEVSEYAPAVSLINEASEEYYANDGNLSEETISKFSEMSSQDLVNAYLEIQAKNGQAILHNKLLKCLKHKLIVLQNAAGGEANYNQSY